jgi:RNA polymerase sigma factor for flagellar operon FliA
MREVGMQPTLSAEDMRIHELFERHRDYARSLARLIAKDLPSHVDFDELAQCAEFGLLEAARRFTPERGAQFTTFAYYRVRGAVFDGVKRVVSLVPRTRRSVDADALADDLLEHECTDMSADADDGELAGQITDAIGFLGTSYLLAHADEVVDSETAADHAEQADALQRLRELLGRLEDGDRALVQALYFEGRSMTEYAVELGVDKAQVSRRHARIVRALRGALGVDA